MLILGTKGGMTYRYDTMGMRIPVTLIHTGVHTVLRSKTPEKDGYAALQLGFGSRKNMTRGMRGQLKNSKLEKAPSIIKEARFPSSDLPSLQAGDTIDPFETLRPGILLKVTGTSKGRGFAGVVKRWGFAGGPKTHGQSDRHRAPGSIGAGTTPGRVFKGKHMAGHKGNAAVSVRNLQVIETNPVDGILAVTGAIPGYRGARVQLEILGEAKHPFASTQNSQPPESSKEHSPQTAPVEETKDSDQASKKDESKKEDA